MYNQRTTINCPTLTLRMNKCDSGVCVCVCVYVCSLSMQEYICTDMSNWLGVSMLKLLLPHTIKYTHTWSDKTCDRLSQTLFTKTLWLATEAFWLHTFTAFSTFFPPNTTISKRSLGTLYLISHLTCWQPSRVHWENKVLGKNDVWLVDR